MPFVKKKEAVVVNQCPCIIAVWLWYLLFKKVWRLLCGALARLKAHRISFQRKNLLCATPCHMIGKQGLTPCIFGRGAERQQCFFEKTPASLSRLAGFCNLGYASLWGVKIIFSGIRYLEKRILQQTRPPAAEGGRAVSAGQCFNQRISG